MLICVAGLCVYLHIPNAILTEVAPQHFSEADADIPVVAAKKFHSMMPDDDDGNDVSASPPAAAYLW